MGKLTKIDAKPEQSKHLETATAIVCGLSVDWVQQRGQEVYTSGSRIPTVVSRNPTSHVVERPTHAEDRLSEVQQKTLNGVILPSTPSSTTYGRDLSRTKRGKVWQISE